MNYVNVIVNVNQTNQLVNNGHPSLGHIFRNIGQVTAFINDFPLRPGEMLDLSAPGGSVDKTKYYIRFDDTPGDRSVYCISKSLPW